MKIGITYDLREDYLRKGYSEEETAEFDSEETISAIEKTINELGYKAERIGNIYNLIKRISSRERWDLVFNIAEGLYGRNRESQVPALLEAYSIPYTFSDPLTLSLCLDKALAKRLVRAAGVQTPEFFTVSSLEELKEDNLKKYLLNCNLTFPLFIKPISEGTGKGISSESIVWNTRNVQSHCINLLNTYGQPVLVEKYLSGKEYTVGILGTGMNAKVIGVLEIEFFENINNDAYSYMNKKFYEQRVKYSIVDDKKILKETSDIALKTYNVLECKDAGRADLRADENGKLYFLEMNPLAGLHPVHSDLIILSRKVGISYKELIGEIINSAVQRINKFPAKEYCIAKN